MSATKYGVKMLVAVNRAIALPLGWHVTLPDSQTEAFDPVLDELDNNSANMEDWDLRVKIPDDTGLYVFNGAVTYYSSGGYFDPVEVDVEWAGDWRPAKLADMRAFGVLRFPATPVPA